MNESEPAGDQRADDAAVDQVLGDQPPAVEGSDDVPAELADAKDSLLRLQAELDNVRKRARRDLQDTLRYAGLPLFRDLLPVLDNVDRAIEAAELAPDGAGLLDGFRMVRRQLEEVLTGHGCTRIEALHEAFDPNVHQAISQQPGGEYPPDTVVTVVQQGYQLHDRVVRPAQVIVSSPDADDS